MQATTTSYLDVLEKIAVDVIRPAAAEIDSAERLAAACGESAWKVSDSDRRNLVDLRELRM